MLMGSRDHKMFLVMRPAKVVCLSAWHGVVGEALGQPLAIDKGATGNASTRLVVANGRLNSKWLANVLLLCHAFSQPRLPSLLRLCPPPLPCAPLPLHGLPSPQTFSKALASAKETLARSLLK